MPSKPMGRQNRRLLNLWGDRPKPNRSQTQAKNQQHQQLENHQSEKKRVNFGIILGLFQN
jgi:hypothetical protein